MDWNNIDLKSGYQRSQDFLDGYSFETLLLELQSNFKTEDLTEEKVLQHAFEQINNKVREAKEILRDNLKQIVQTEQHERKERQTQH